MTEFFQALVEFRFMQHALLACLLASLGCGVMGVYMVVKRIGFLAGGIAHSVLAGMGIAYFAGAAPMAGAVVSALAAAVCIGMIKMRWRQDEDILIAAFWSGGMAVGVLFISQTPGYQVDLMSYLFGNILLVSGQDLLLMLLLDGIILTAAFVFYKIFLATVFDEEFARLRGVRVELHYILLLCLIALTVVLFIQIVGLALVIALLALPAASAAQFVSSLGKMMLLAVFFSLLATCAGLMASYQPNLPSGALMIVAACLVYILCVAARRLFSTGPAGSGSRGEGRD